METLLSLIVFIVGVLFGGIVIWLFLHSRTGYVREQTLAQISSERAALQERIQARDQDIEELKTALSGAREVEQELRERLKQESERRAELAARMEEERKAAQEKLDLLNDAKQNLSDAFKALSAEALRSNNQSFLDLAKTVLEKFQEGAKSDLETRQKAIDDLIAPVKESLNKVDAGIQELEKARLAAYSTLTEQVKSLGLTQAQLKDETSKLVRALRTPTVRGRWGEIQLRRVVEIAGMMPYCDFVEQSSISTEDGRLRPDLIVKLPGQKNVVVDAKAPLDAYLNAMETEDEDLKRIHLQRHAQQIRDHTNKLSSKAYWEQFQPTPEFVVMFLPGETFFSAALEQYPGLIEEGVCQRVIPASPTTIIALLRAVAYGWRQEKIAESAEMVSNLGRELFERLRVLAGHFEKMGRGLDSAVEAYNKAIGSFESRVLVAARRFTEFGVASNREIPLLAPLERAPRTIQTKEPDQE
jgi:DNA recombination protein RmuC